MLGKVGAGATRWNFGSGAGAAGTSLLLKNPALALTATAKSAPLRAPALRKSSAESLSLLAIAKSRAVQP